MKFTTTMKTIFHIILTLLTALSLGSGVRAEPPVLVYHCALDSEQAIAEPQVGPAGEVVRGGFVFAPAIGGANGLTAGSADASPRTWGGCFKIPAPELLGDEGTLAFWLKLRGHFALGVPASTAIADTRPREGHVLDYRFAGNAIDSSGSQRHGTVHGSPRFAAGKSGRCLVRDGRQDYIDCGAGLARLGPAFTVEFWVNPAESQQSNANLFGNHFPGGLSHHPA